MPNEFHKRCFSPISCHFRSKQNKGVFLIHTINLNQVIPEELRNLIFSALGEKLTLTAINISRFKIYFNSMAWACKFPLGVLKFMF